MNDKPERETILPDAWIAAREAKGITLRRVAELTNIPFRKLEALERQDFEALGDPTFAKGYIRNYARTLDLDPEEMLRVYGEQNRGRIAEPSRLFAPGVSRRRNYSDFFKKISVLQLAFVAILIWLAAMFFRGGDPDETRPVVTNPSGDSPSATADTSRSGNVLANDPSPGNLSAGSRPDTGIAVDDQTNDMSVDDSLPATANETPDTASALRPEPPVAGNREARADANVADATLEAEVAAAENVAEDLLVLSFSEDCWVNIEDANGRVLIAELKRKGDNLRVFGQAPFSVLLGNARAVNLSVNGRAVATEPRGTNKTLRMTVAG